MMLPLLRRLTSRFLKELILAFVVGLIADIGIDAVRDWAKNRPKEQIAEAPVERTEIASQVVPPLEEVTIVEEPKIAQKEKPGPLHFPDGTAVYPHTCNVRGKGEVVFDVVVFSDSFSWMFERIDQISGLGGEKEFRKLLARPYYQDVMKKARHIIVAGTASCEGTEWSEEDDRAVDRAVTLKSWLEGERSSSDVSLPTKSLHTLNLGRYWDDCAERRACISRQPGDTLNQRKIILMAVKNDVPNLIREDFEACIAGSMKADPQLDLLTRHYCRSDVNVRPNGEST
jgi:hypothetical protein